ncbi:MAG TPA: MATE family efflux transporter [Burkholderiaceae bacterium]
MLEAPIVPMLLRLGWPNIVMMLAQSATGLIETWQIARLGTDALAGIAVVVPVLMLMQNMSQGAMGGGISSAIARRLGAGDPAGADRLVRHAVVLNACIGAVCAALLLFAGPWLYHLLGVDGPALRAALSYSNVLCLGFVPLWVMNACASAIRGTGNMLVPGAVICGGALLLVPVAWGLIFGIGPVPALGVAGGAWALLAYYAGGMLVLGWYCMGGRNAARLARGPLHWAPMRDILAVGGLASINAVLTNALIVSTSAIVGAHAGTAALAGYATGARLEYLLLPVAFGLGAPMVALVGSNIGAGQRERARRIALAGGCMAFALAEVIGLAAALWPHAWLGLFSSDPRMLATGAQYLRIVGPFYGFFALGFSLYFASQGAGRLRWPLQAAALRLAVCVGAGWAVLAATGSLAVFFALGAAAMVLYGVVVAWSVAARTWFAPRHGEVLSPA